MGTPKKSCRACKGTGWTAGPVKPEIAREDGGRVEYPTVVRCTCLGSTDIPDDARPSAVDRKSRAAGEPGENG